MAKVSKCKVINTCVNCCAFGGGYPDVNNLLWFVCIQELTYKVFILVAGNYTFNPSWTIYNWYGHDPRTEIPNNRCKLRNQK